MIEIKEYRKLDNCIVVGRIEDGVLKNFSVADNNMELVTVETFSSAYAAIIFGMEYKGLVG